MFRAGGRCPRYPRSQSSHVSSSIRAKKPHVKPCERALSLCPVYSPSDMVARNKYYTQVEASHLNIFLHSATQHAHGTVKTILPAPRIPGENCKALTPSMPLSHGRGNKRMNKGRGPSSMTSTLNHSTHRFWCSTEMYIHTYTRTSTKQVIYQYFERVISGRYTHFEKPPPF